MIVGRGFYEEFSVKSYILEVQSGAGTRLVRALSKKDRTFRVIIDCCAHMHYKMSHRISLTMASPNDVVLPCPPRSFVNSSFLPLPKTVLTALMIESAAASCPK